MAFRMMLNAQPFDIERFGVVVMVGLDARLVADFARLADEFAGFESVADATVSIFFLFVFLIPSVLTLFFDFFGGYSSIGPSPC